MALGTRYDLEIHRGDDRDLDFTVVDPAGDAVDITTAALTYSVSKLDSSQSDPAPRGAVALFTKTVGSGITITNGPNGEATITLASADTTGLQTPADYYHEIQSVLTKTTTIMYGILTLKRDLASPGP